jgi:hypothetical protein
MGLMGIVVGASAAGTAAVARSVSDAVLPRMMGRADRKHQMSTHSAAKQFNGGGPV